MQGPQSADSEAEDEEVAEAGFGGRDSTEGCVMTEFATEGCPGLEGGGTGISSLGDKSGVCGLQRNAEISVEAIPGRRVCRCQGRGNG